MKEAKGRYDLALAQVQKDCVRAKEYKLFGPLGATANPFMNRGGAVPQGNATRSPTAQAAHTVPPPCVDQQVFVELLRTQQEMLRQNQVLMTRMVHRMEQEDRQREEERAERAALKAAEEALLKEFPWTRFLEQLAERRYFSARGLYFLCIMTAPLLGAYFQK